MDKLQLIVLGLSASPAGNNAYALILKEANGDRRLPIIIGAFEAQAIALEMEGVVPPRPMTHDLLKSLVDTFGATLTEVFINDLKDGTFYAQLIFDDGAYEVDVRPSDAIALAVRCNSPIFVNSEVFEETGVFPQPGENDPEEEDEDLKFLKNQKEKLAEQQKPKSRVSQLQTLLDKAITDEDYERAAKIRDEIQRFLERS